MKALCLFTIILRFPAIQRGIEINVSSISCKENARTKKKNSCIVHSPIRKFFLCINNNDLKGGISGEC